MEVHSYSGEKGPLVALVLALIVLGLGSLYLTWRSIAHQREIVEENMIMTGSSILRGVDSNISRIMRSLSMNPQAAPLFPTMVGELFTELARSEDIKFIAMYGGGDTPIITSDADRSKPTFSLPETVAADLEVGRAWHVMAEFEKNQVLISGLRVRPSVARLSFGSTLPLRHKSVRPDENHVPEAERGMGHGMGRGRGRGMGSGHSLEPGGGNPPMDAGLPHVYLVVGLNAQKHMAQFRQYRSAAIYQTGYVFLAAVVLWSLVFAYLQRRGEGRKLDRMERFQNKLLDNMPDGLVTLAEDGQIMAANHSAKKLLAPKDEDGVPEIIGSNWRDLAFGSRFDETSLAPTDWQQFDYQGRRLEILSLPFQASDEDAAPELGQRLVLIRDRTQIRSLEEDLNEAQRLAAVGSLAAGVAHEVRNPLSSLRGFAQLFANKLKGQQPLEQYATTMVQEADRLNRVVTDLLYLAKPRQLDPVAIDLAELGDSIRQLMRFDFENRQTEPVFDFRCETVMADQDALKQVLLNLISNSLDALGACDDCPTPGHISLSSVQADDGVWIIVADDGPGMNPVIRDEVFKPFVTGKKTGTGLGLAIVDNIMRAHRGRVAVDSEPGEGTRIRLFFPDVEPKG